MFGLFQINLRQALVVLLVIALPIIAINIERRNPGDLRWYDRPLTYFISPAQEAFSNFSIGITSTVSFYLNLLDVKKENRLLKEEVEKMKLAMASLEEIKSENKRLDSLLQFQSHRTSIMIPAQVVASDLFSSDYASIKINKGARDNIKKGMGVLTPEGVVGYVLSVQNSYATVLLLTDRNAVIDSVVQRTRARGISEGMGRDAVKLKYVQRTDEIAPGDVAVTGGQDGAFPKGVPLGIVTSVVRTKFGVSQKVEMKPAIDVSRVEEVLVILDPANWSQPATQKEEKVE
jgi:rod shape-determining protein MreC